MAAESLSLAPGIWLGIGWTLVLCLVALRLNSVDTGDRRLWWAVALLIAVLSAARWELAEAAWDAAPLQRLAQQGKTTATIRARVTSVPFEYQRPSSQPRTWQGSQWQTRFTVDCQTVFTGAKSIRVDESLRVYVDGRAARRCRRGDVVQMLGRLSAPQPPGNPGQFDTSVFFRRRRVSGMFSVGHPDAVTAIDPVGPWHPLSLLTALRRDAQRALTAAVSDDNLAIASALLLGSRNELRAQTEETFIGSGTMHLLAISGLHLGILCLLLIRLGHLLLIPWNQRLTGIAGFCLVYALVTDMRPSVVRATIFIWIFAFSEVCLRRVRAFSVLSLTAVFMLLFQPHLVFDTGAWLSFLSVLSLAWALQTTPKRDDLAAGPAPLTWKERRDDLWVRLRTMVASRYRPMLWILIATVPLTAAEFHVISPMALVVNVALIAWTVVTLWAGFATLVFGMLLPWIPNLPGYVFSLMLTALQGTVAAAGQPGIGHVYVADLPHWVLPAWYGLLGFALIVSRWRWLCHLGLIAIAAVVLFDRSPAPDGVLTCTVLDIGHGSAAVVELPDGQVLLVDCGAMNQGDRSGDLMSQFLWSRGRRSINSLLISHADADHFNGVRKLLSRFPLGEILISKQFVRNDAKTVRFLLTESERQGVPLRIMRAGDTARTGRVKIQILQADPILLEHAKSDNERSPVVCLQYGDRRLCLPGDLEGPAMMQLLPQLAAQDVLVSPHHGSLKANTPRVAEQLRPTHVIVSARDTKYKSHLENVYTDSTLHFTNDAGSVRVRIHADGRLSIDRFRHGKF